MQADDKTETQSGLSENKNMCLIGDLASKGTVGELVTVVGVVVRLWNASKVLIKSTQQETTRMNLTLLDDSNSPIELTLWGEDAEKLAENAQGRVVLCTIRRLCRKISRRRLNHSAYLGS